MNRLNKILLGSVAVVTMANAPVVPVDKPIEKHLSTPERAIEWRKHLREREEYYRSQGMAEKHINQAVHARNELEEKLVKKGMITKKWENDDKIKPPKKERQSIVKTVATTDFISRAIAYDWGKEDLESCTTGTLPCNFNSNDSWGSQTMTIDTGSEVNDSNSLKCVFTGESGCYLTESSDISSSATYYYQQTVKLGSGFSYGASAYVTLTEISDTGSTQIMYITVEDYGSNRLVFNGPGLTYTDTGIDITTNAVTKIEIMVDVNATTGDIDIWVNNDTEGSPDYDGSGSLNTGSTNVGEVVFGMFYNPDANSTIFYDDAIGDTGFIGAGETPTSTPSTNSGKSVIWFD